MKDLLSDLEQGAVQSPMFLNDFILKDVFLNLLEKVGNYFAVEHKWFLLTNESFSGKKTRNRFVLKKQSLQQLTLEKDPTFDKCILELSCKSTLETYLGTF